MGSWEVQARWLKTQATDVSGTLQSGVPASASAGHDALLRWCPPGTWRWHHMPGPPGTVQSHGWHSGSHLPAQTPALGVMKGIRGNATHAQHRPQRQQTGACAVGKVDFVKWGGRKCSCEVLKCTSSLTLLVYWVRRQAISLPVCRIYTLSRIPTIVLHYVLQHFLFLPNKLYKCNDSEESITLKKGKLRNLSGIYSAFE